MDLTFTGLRCALPKAGRNVIVKLDSLGVMSDINPAPLNARTRVHEYGGGDYVVRNGAVYFAEFFGSTDLQVGRRATPEPITPVADIRYADP